MSAFLQQVIRSWSTLCPLGIELVKPFIDEEMEIQRGIATQLISNRMTSQMAQPPFCLLTRKQIG